MGTRAAVVLAAVALVAGGWWWVGRGGEDPLPEAFYGTWVTSNERYAGRGFSIAPETLTLFTGDTSTRHRIRETRRRVEDGVTVWTIHYEDAGGVVPFPIEPGPLHGGPDDRLYFPHQPEIEWRREGD